MPDVLHDKLMATIRRGPKHCPHCGALHTRPKPVQPPEDSVISKGTLTLNMLRATHTNFSISSDGGQTWTQLGEVTGPIGFLSPGSVGFADTHVRSDWQE